MQKRLLDIRQLSNFYVFQQDCTLVTVEAPEFIPPTFLPPNGPDLNPVDYKVCSVMQENVYKKRIKELTNCVHVS